MGMRIENRSSTMPLGEMSNNGSAAVEFFVDGIEQEWMKEADVLAPKKRDLAKAQTRKAIADLRVTIQTMRSKNKSYNDILFQIQPMVSELREAQIKRIADFQKSEQNQTRETQKADNVFKKLAELHLPPFDVGY